MTVSRLSVFNITFDMGAITEALIRKGVLTERRALHQIDTNSIIIIIISIEEINFTDT